MNKQISIIVPAYNEADYIEITINALLKWSVETEIIVVDDGSVDNTAEILNVCEALTNIKVLYLERNYGKGQALTKGLEIANGEIIIFLDADLGESALFAEKLLSPILDKNIAMSIATFPKPQKKGGFGLVKGLARRGIYLMTGYNSIAPLSGQRGFKKEVIKQIDLLDGFGIEVGLTIDVLKKGFTIEEIEIPLKHRESGRNLKGFLHRGREFKAVVKALFIKWREHSRWR